MNASTTIQFEWRGRNVIVRKNDAHPENYMYIEFDGGQYFLGVSVPGTTRGTVKKMAVAWLSNTLPEIETPRKRRS